MATYIVGTQKTRLNEHPKYNGSVGQHFFKNCVQGR